MNCHTCRAKNIHDTMRKIAPGYYRCSHCGRQWQAEWRKPRPAPKPEPITLSGDNIPFEIAEEQKEKPTH